MDNTRPTTAQRNRAIKKALVNHYGKLCATLISVKGDTGTAYGWINIRIELPAPAGHVHDTMNYGYCRSCNDNYRKESQTVSSICHTTAKEIGSYIGTYCSDMGEDRDEILINIIYK